MKDKEYTLDEEQKLRARFWDLYKAEDLAYGEDYHDAGDVRILAERALTTFVAELYHSRRSEELQKQSDFTISELQKEVAKLTKENDSFESDINDLKTLCRDMATLDEKSQSTIELQRKELEELKSLKASGTEEREIWIGWLKKRLHIPEAKFDYVRFALSELQEHNASQKLEIEGLVEGLKVAHSTLISMYTRFGSQMNENDLQLLRSEMAKALNAIPLTTLNQNKQTLPEREK